MISEYNVIVSSAISDFAALKEERPEISLFCSQEEPLIKRLHSADEVVAGSSSGPVLLPVCIIFKKKRKYIKEPHVGNWTVEKLSQSEHNSNHSLIRAADYNMIFW